MLGLLLAGAVLSLPAVRDIEEWSYDQRLRNRPYKEPLSDLVIVGIDADSLRRIDAPGYLLKPFFAEFLKAMTQARASSLFLDVILDVNVDTVVQNLVRERSQLLNVPLPPNFISDLGFELPFRQALLEAGRSGLKVVMEFHKEANGAVSGMHQLLSLIIPANQRGFTNLLTSPDGIIRRVNLSVPDPITGKRHPSVALAVA